MICRRCKYADWTPKIANQRINGYCNHPGALYVLQPVNSKRKRPRIPIWADVPKWCPLKREPEYNRREQIILLQNAIKRTKNKIIELGTADNLEYDEYDIAYYELKYKLERQEKHLEGLLNNGNNR